MRVLSHLRHSLPGLLPLLFAGCMTGDSGPQPASSSGTAASTTTLHAVMSEQLVVDTARLNSLLFDLHRTETVLARERGTQYRRIADSARSLQQGAVQIAALGSGLQLSEDRLLRFRSLAGQLETLAANLAVGAGSSELGPDQMSEILTSIDSTCNTCHSLYRDP